MEKRTLLCCWWEYELVQPLWRIVRRLLKKLKTELLLYDPAIPLLGIYPEKTLIQKAMCTPVLICCCAQLLQSCLTFCYPMDGSLPASSVHGILQASILESIVIFSSRDLYVYIVANQCLLHLIYIGRQVLYH